MSRPDAIVSTATVRWKAIGDLIRAARAQSGLSRRQFAKTLSYSHEAVSLAESGKVNPDRVWAAWQARGEQP